MHFVLKLVNVMGVAALTALTILMNAGNFTGWSMQVLALVLCPYAVFLCATLASARAGTSIGIGLTMGLTGIAGLLAYLSLRTFGEWSLPMILVVPLAQGIFAIGALLFAGIERWRMRKRSEEHT